MKLYKYLAISLFCLWSCSNVDDTSSTTVLNEIIDDRDGQIYKTVTIGTQTWFAQNLNYASHRHPG